MNRLADAIKDVLRACQVPNTADPVAVESAIRALYQLGVDHGNSIVADPPWPPNPFVYWWENLE